jgi:hypothetical protein
MDILLQKLTFIDVPMIGTSSVGLSISSMQYVKKNNNIELAGT